MNSVLIPVFGAITYLVGMKLNSQYIDRKVVADDGQLATPARMPVSSNEATSLRRTLSFSRKEEKGRLLEYPLGFRGRIDRVQKLLLPDVRAIVPRLDHDIQSVDKIRETFRYLFR